MGKPSSRKDPDTGRNGPPSIPRSDDDLLAECRVDTFRSGGKGGQHQNKVESGVRLTHGPTGVVTTSRRFRSQKQNRERALLRLRQRLEALNQPEKPRIATAVPVKERRKRVENKKKRSRLKRLRAKPEDAD